MFWNLLFSVYVNLVDRESNYKSCTLIRFRIKFHLTMMQINYTFDNSQSNARPGSIGLHLIESIKDLWLLLLADSNPIIRHDELKRLAVIGDDTTQAYPVFGIFQRIHHQITNHFRHPLRVNDGGKISRWIVDTKVNPLLLEERLEADDHRFHQITDIL